MLDGWERDGDSIVKTFETATYPQGLAFAGAAGMVADGMNHHPDISIGWKKVTLVFTTHDADSKISQNDIVMEGNVLSHTVSLVYADGTPFIVPDGETITVNLTYENHNYNTTQDWDKDTIALQETFKVVLLNNSNKVKGVYQISQGGITGTLVDIRILFAVILKTLSVSVILAHNHPSGNLVAGPADRAITKKIQKASKLFDVKVLDHILLAPNGDYYSFSDDKIL